MFITVNGHNSSHGLIIAVTTAWSRIYDDHHCNTVYNVCQKQKKKKKPSLHVCNT